MILMYFNPELHLKLICVNIYIHNCTKLFYLTQLNLVVTWIFEHRAALEVMGGLNNLY